MCERGCKDQGRDLGARRRGQPLERRGFALEFVHDRLTCRIRDRSRIERVRAPERTCEHRQSLAVVSRDETPRLDFDRAARHGGHVPAGELGRDRPHARQ